MQDSPFRILVIEDYVPDVELIREALNQVGLTYELINATDGRQALDVMRAAEEEGEGAFVPDLVLLDLHLPNLSGIEVLTAIRTSRHLADLAVIVVSGSRSVDERRQLEELGAEMYWTKPLSETGFLDLAEVVKAVAGGFKEKRGD